MPSLGLVRLIASSTVGATTVAKYLVVMCFVVMNGTVGSRGAKPRP